MTGSGRRPDAGTAFTATYRVGNGSRGNIGADALVHIVAAPGVAGAIASVRNPLPAVGGAEPESLEDVRQRAPSAFRTQERAVTPADYAEVTGAQPADPAGRGHAALDRQLAHGLHHRRPRRRR